MNIGQLEAKYLDRYSELQGGASNLYEQELIDLQNEISELQNSTFVKSEYVIEKVV